MKYIYAAYLCNYHDEMSTIPAQQEAVDLAAKALGVTVSIVFSDMKASSDGTENRPGLQALIAAVQAGEITAVIVPSHDRLARDLSNRRDIVQNRLKASSSFRNCLYIEPIAQTVKA